MTPRTTITRRITREEFETVRDAAKVELKGIRLSFSYHGKSGAKYARGTFDVRPVRNVEEKRTGFTHEETAQIIAWLRNAGFYIQPYEHENVVYAGQGFGYITKVAS